MIPVGDVQLSSIYYYNITRLVFVWYFSILSLALVSVSVYVRVFVDECYKCLMFKILIYCALIDRGGVFVFKFGICVSGWRVHIIICTLTCSIKIIFGFLHYTFTYLIMYAFKVYIHNDTVGECIYLLFFYLRNVSNEQLN